MISTKYCDFGSIAVGVAMLVYNSRTQPKYVKMEETIVEDFKEWTAKKGKNKSLQRTLQSTIWTLTVPVYLLIGVFLNAWHPGWLIFPLAAAVSMLIRLVFVYQEEE